MITARRESENSGCSSWFLALVVINAVSRGLQSRGLRENVLPVVLVVIGVVLLVAAVYALLNTLRSHSRSRFGMRRGRGHVTDPRDSPLYDRDLDAWPH